MYLVIFVVSDYTTHSRLERPSVTITSPGSPGTTRIRPHSPKPASSCGKLQVTNGQDFWKIHVYCETHQIAPFLLFSQRSYASVPLSWTRTDIFELI